jgi:hypothetical protein
MRDLRHALRALTRTPGFLAISVATLGLAIGVTAGLFSVVNAVLIHPLPYAAADRLVYIAATAPGSDLPAEFGVSAEFFVHYKEQSRLIEDVAVFNSFTSTLRVGDRVERVRMSSPSVSLFSTLGARTVIGRLPLEADEDRVAVISHAFVDVVVRRRQSQCSTAPPTFPAPTARSSACSSRNSAPDDGTVVWYPSVIRLDPHRCRTLRRTTRRADDAGRPRSSAAELTTLARGLPARFGGTAAYAKVIAQHRAIVRPLDEQLLGRVARPLWILFGAVGIVLLIACANVANLFTVRAEGRQRELAVRRAIGAGRAQLIRLQMSEAMVVAMLAGVAAMLFAWLTLPAFLSAVPPACRGLPTCASTPRRSGSRSRSRCSRVLPAAPFLRSARRRRTSRGCAKAAAERRVAATGVATDSSSSRRRSRSCSSSARRCWCAASWRSGASIRGTTRRTSSRFRSRPKDRISPTVLHTRVSIWISWIVCARSRGSSSSAS